MAQNFPTAMQTGDVHLAVYDVGAERTYLATGTTDANGTAFTRKACNAPLRAFDNAVLWAEPKPKPAAAAKFAAWAPAFTKCSVCTAIVGKATDIILEHGCGFITRLEGAALCEAIGFGPEDPAADICVAIVEGSCRTILKLLKEGIKEPTRICDVLDLCPGR